MRYVNNLFLKLSSYNGSLEVINRVKVCSEDKTNNTSKEAVSVYEFESKRYQTNYIDVTMEFFCYLVLKFRFGNKNSKKISEGYFTFNTILGLKRIMKDMMNRINNGKCFIQDSTSGDILTCSGNELSIKTVNSIIVMYPEVAYDDIETELGIVFSSVEWEGELFFLKLDDFEVLNDFIQNFNLQLSSQITSTNYNIIKEQL